MDFPEGEYGTANHENGDAPLTKVFFELVGCGCGSCVDWVVYPVGYSGREPYGANGLPFGRAAALPSSVSRQRRADR